MERIPRAINNLLYEAIEKIENITDSNVLVVNAPISDELYNFALSQEDDKMALEVVFNED